MHDGETTESTDPFAATPRAFAVRFRKDPSAPRSTRTSPMVLVQLVLGALCGVAFIAVGSQPGRSPLWQSLLPPLLVFVGSWGYVIRRARRQARAQDASKLALSATTPPIAVRLRVTWGSCRHHQVTNRMTVVDATTGALVGHVTVLIAPGVFDPRGLLWLHGPVEAGAAVALVSEQGIPMLTAGPFVVEEPDPPMTLHPCSDLVDRLLGWSEPLPPVPVAATGLVPIGPAPVPALSPGLVAAAQATNLRMRNIGVWGLLAVVLLIPFSMALRPSLGVSVAMTALVWGGWRSIVRWGGDRVVRPATAALQHEEGLSADDARFVARALASLRFGLAAAGTDATEAAADQPPALPAGADASAPPPGWGYAPR